MPGIYGLANCRDLQGNLQKMANVMHLYDHFHSQDLFFDNMVGASRAYIGETDTRTEFAGHASYTIWVEGEAYNVDEVAKNLGVKARNLAELLLKAETLKKLDSCLNGLNGYFCAALYCSRRQKLKLMSDRHGMRLLYWYNKNGLFAWGSEVKAILAITEVDKKIDYSSYDCFMNLGHLMAENTWFENIKLIKPASIIEYDMRSNKIIQKHYWKWSEIKPSILTFEQAVEELGKRFIKAVGRQFRPNERIGISLSGGLDSRAIFAAVNHLYPDYNGYAYTFGAPNCDDITIAQEVVGRSNSWEHEVFYLKEDNWFDGRKEMVWNTDGMLDMMHMHGGEFAPVISERIDVNLNGYLGDAVLGGSYLK